jgi:hypothetical protein
MTDIETARRTLIKELMEKCGLWTDAIASFLDGCRYVPQDDGGMGSFSVVSNDERTGVSDCSEAEYTDSDGMQVIIALIVDEDGFPTDVDFWKVDSSPLVRFPEPSRIIVTCKSNG